ncbi:MAG: cbb3-type cytochrome c oxidase subunit I [Halodesulfurarchaeum sp.]|nr:cbb3-type cytochrome c oxidase subunit I [Halodesulfurarchaeum sp.]
MVGITNVALSAGMGVVLLAVATRLARDRPVSRLIPDGGVRGAHEDVYSHEEKPAGILRWLTTVDHKDIGLMYGAYAFFAFAWAGVSVLLMRTELLTPDATIISLNSYNTLLTTHGTTMLIVFGTPILAAFANYFLPLLLGADDMAFPRVNAIAFWLLPPGALLIWAGFFLPVIEPSATAWTMYTPLASQSANAGVDLFLLGQHLIGVSGILSGINFITTVFTEREVSWGELDIFSWTILTQAGQIVFAFPMLGAALIMLIMDRNFGTTFFAIEGGSPILWQHLFWFFGHPEVYILILPPMGIISLVIPRFSGRKLFGFKFVVYSTLAIGVLSFGVWAHHMFTTGIDPRIRASFMAVTLAIAVPSAVKAFNWITTLWNGRIRLKTPMLFALGFIFNFIVGGITGVFLGAIPVDIYVHDTYYIVGHFHYMLMGGAVFAVFAGFYYWFPLFTGRYYDEVTGKIHFWFTFVGTQLTFTAMMIMGWGGMPRRYATYLPQFFDMHVLSTLGAYIIAIGMVIGLVNVILSWLYGDRVRTGDPWDLEPDGLKTPDWEWFEQNRVKPLTDGGTEESEANPSREEQS